MADQPIDTTDQQAVTVAQEDRDAAAACARALGDGFTQHIIDGVEDDTAIVQAFARHRLASVSSASAEIPADMKPWMGGDGAPYDWDGGSVLRADGQTEHSDDITIQQWKHPVPRCKWNVVAYTPAHVLNLPEPVPATNQAGEVESFVEQLRDRAESRDCMGYDATADQLRQAADMIERLAAQPATSQEGERDAIAQIIRSYCEDGVRAEPFGGSLDNADLAADRILALAATPTPPTPTEDAIRKALDNAQSKLGHVRIGAMNGDNLAVTLCTHFDDGEGDEDENGWTPAASDGCDDTLKAIHAVYVAALAQVKAS